MKENGESSGMETSPVTTKKENVDETEDIIHRSTTKPTISATVKKSKEVEETTKQTQSAKTSTFDAYK